ncbi:MAG: hypothetical protein ACTSQF_00285 [Candidatus Heimdallarchaeaceae archaeon]
MIKRTPQALIDDYFEDTQHLSQSKIKLILKGMDVFNKEKDEKDLYYEEKGHFIIGNGVDILLTQTRKEFDEQFAVLTVDKPGPKLMSVIHRIFDTYIIEKDTEQIRHSTLGMSVESQIILDSAAAEGFQSAWVSKTMIANVIKNGQDYFDSLCMNYGKQLVSPDEMHTINEIVESLSTNIRTKFLFKESINKDIDILYQFPVYFFIGEILCKALLDIVIVNHTEKIVIPYDLKTMGDYTINFDIQARRMRYDIQAAFYTEALTVHFEGYTINPFIFVVESTIQQGNPLLFETSGDFISIGRYGRAEGYSRLYDDKDTDEYFQEIYHKPIHGFMEGIKLYKWYLENGFEQDKLVKEHSGYLYLEWNKVS